MLPPLAALLAAVVLPAGPSRADALKGAAEVISDGSFWLMPAMPPALTLFGGKHEERIGRRMLDTAVATGVVTEALKHLTRASRPDDPRATDGFPSGHASEAWALAEAAGAEDPHLRPYTYTFAAAVTWSRVKLRRHSALQALAGAALGYGMARASASCRKGLFGGLIVKSPKAGGVSPLAESSAAATPSVNPPLVTLWETHW